MPVRRLTGAYRSLPRPSSPPDARASTVRPCSLDHYSTHERISDSAFGIGCQRAGAQYFAPKSNNINPPPLFERKDGGGERDRTDGLLVANQALSQLSYTPARQPTSPAARVSVDPGTPEMRGGPR